MQDHYANDGRIHHFPLKLVIFGEVAETALQMLNAGDSFTKCICPDLAWIPCPTCPRMSKALMFPLNYDCKLTVRRGAAA